MQKELAAIGETGLDYYNATAPKELQTEQFIRYIDLAKRSSLPLMIHCRSAFHDCFQLLDHYYKGAPFLIHCFTGTLEEAYQVLERGGYLSFSGIATFKKSTALQEVIAKIPLDQVVIETDAPFLAPHPFRGSVNEPALVAYVAKTIAEIKEKPVEEIAATLTHNAKTFFRL
jgi:TatD DNase family protein